MFTTISINKKYRSNSNNIPKDFLIPLLENAIEYKRAVGYFSTSSLVNLSVGLCSMAQRDSKIKVVCSPNLSIEDIEAINLGYKSKEKAFIDALDNALTKPINAFEEERLNLVANLVAMGILNFKLAFMESNTGVNVYHEKIAIAYDTEGNRVSFTGSMNDSKNGFIDNFESIVVFCDWKSYDQQQYIDETEKDFEELWNDTTNKVRTIEFPKIILNKLLNYKKSKIDYLIDSKEYIDDVRSLTKSNFIKMPHYVNLLDYQKEAIRNWKNQGYIGIYDMATGTGKTYTALGSILYLSKELDDNIAVFILCPYVHLVGQWEEDLIQWGVRPIVAHGQSSDENWEKRLICSYKHFKKFKKPFVCVTTNDTYISEKIQKVINNITPDMNIMVVVDEAHNIGSKTMSNYLNYNIKYRLALSATIERYKDKSGTDCIYNYFKGKCIEYPLSKAIEEGKALCKYEYHVIYSFLSPEELNKYQRITKELKKYVIYKNGKKKYNDCGKIKLFERRRILAGARDKIDLLENVMSKYKYDKFILVYCGATSILDEETNCYEKQILLVNKMIENKLNMSVHKFTAEENAKERMTIKECFAKGMYQVLTAIKCLDEGVNIPNIQTAFILSSSQNPKEFVQRRGRLLRKSKGKDKAVIYDFVTLPRPFGSIHYGDYELDRSILISEMIRIKKFAETAINKADGLNVIDEIQEAYGISIDIDAEIEKLREDDFSE